LAYNGQTRGNYDEKAIEFISYESFLRAQRTQLLLFLEVHAFGKTHEKRKQVAARGLSKVVCVPQETIEYRRITINRWWQEAVLSGVNGPGTGG
jgi:hypothetical protein